MNKFQRNKLIEKIKELAGTKEDMKKFIEESHHVFKYNRYFQYERFSNELEEQYRDGIKRDLEVELTTEVIDLVDGLFKDYLSLEFWRAARDVDAKQVEIEVEKMYGNREIHPVSIPYKDGGTLAYLIPLEERLQEMECSSDYFKDTQADYLVAAFSCAKPRWQSVYVKYDTIEFTKQTTKTTTLIEGTKRKLVALLEHEKGYGETEINEFDKLGTEKLNLVIESYKDKILKYLDNPIIKSVTYRSGELHVNFKVDECNEY